MPSLDPQQKNDMASDSVFVGGYMDTRLSFAKLNCKYIISTEFHIPSRSEMLTEASQPNH